MTKKQDIVKAVEKVLKAQQKPAQKKDIVATAKVWGTKTFNAKVTGTKTMQYKTKDGELHKGHLITYDNGYKLAVGKSKFGSSKNWNIV